MWPAQLLKLGIYLQLYIISDRAHLQSLTRLHDFNTPYDQTKLHLDSSTVRCVADSVDRLARIVCRLK
jgi:hypothetical protein